MTYIGDVVLVSS